MSENEEDLGTTRQTVDIDMRLYLKAKERMATQRLRKFGEYCVGLIRSDLNEPVSLTQGAKAKTEQDPLLARLSSKDRARVVALIEMLSGESTGVEHLDLMRNPVIGYLDTWASQTRKPSSGKKASGKHA